MDFTDYLLFQDWGSAWTNDYEDSAGRSKHRFFLILQTYFAISDNPQKMQALYLLWGSILDAVISREEMISSLKKFTGTGEFIFKILKLLCGGKMNICLDLSL
ncbi:hypothetical protein AVEN_220102-1 [Araneus ventricosus]|uniref:Uncharacterized protein n=1 Tax=Araneus ventricosus TaxID=182803 RepID=A0A4Y2AUB3_ARAVE|nr:hypothetical protein AVEN_220102-1 [Araneus ventricosus]